MSDHYEVLGVASDATPTEVRQRYRALKQLYEDSLGSYGLVEEDERDATLAAVEAAFATLSDGERRHAYDQALAATGHVGPWYRDLQPTLPMQERDGSVAPVARVPEGRAPPSVVDAPLSAERLAELDAVIAKSPRHGAYLRAVRERAGIELETVSQALKITVTQLQNIEGHRFEKLPAPVYLKGFLRGYARFLRVPDDEVVAAYLELRAAWEELES